MSGASQEPEHTNFQQIMSRRHDAHTILNITQLGSISTKDVLEKGTLIVSFNLSPQDAITITNLILEMPSEESGNITIEFP